MTKINPTPSPEIDFEQIERDLGKLLIEVVCERSNNFATLSDKMRKEWLKHAQELVALYNWRENPKIAIFPAAQVAVGALQLVTVGASEETAKFLGNGEKVINIGHEFFKTSDTGKRTEIEAKRDSARMSHESTDREQQSLMQQLTDLMRKMDDAQRKNLDSHLGMAR